ncbi:MAG: energy transducer TonB [Pseudomonadota bacterium]
MQPNDWKLPLNFAIGLHIMLLLGALYLPGFFKAKPKFADIYTVSLINIAEPVLAPPSPKPQAPAPTPPKVQESAPPPPAPEAPPKIKKAAPIAEVPDKVAPAPAPDPTPAKAISLKPLKQKIIKEIKEEKEVKEVKEIKEKQVTPKKNDEELKKVQKLAEAIREEAVMNERARLAQEALAQERKVFAQSNKGRVTQNAESSVGPQTSAPAVSGSSSNLLETQYQAAIASRLQQFWAIPEYLQKDPNLTAIVAITIRIDGNIASVVFESKSGDHIFDQFVSKTIESANPMPPIPPALKKQRYDIGFRFKPGSIQ